MTAGLVAYLIVLATLFALQRQLLFPAGKEPPSLERAGLAGLMDPVKIVTADGLDLVAWYRSPPNRNAPLIVLFHGNGGTIEIRAAKAKTYISAGFGVLLPEYRGYGGNPGSPSETGIYADGRAALAFAAAQGIAPDHWILLGESLGTGVAVQMATEQRVAALVLEAPYTSICGRGAEPFPVPASLVVGSRSLRLRREDRARRRAAVRRSRRARRNHPREVRTSVVHGRSGAEGGHVAAGCWT